jgi:hypothetical protein
VTQRWRETDSNCRSPRDNDLLLTIHLTVFDADPKYKLWSTSQEGA